MARHRCLRRDGQLMNAGKEVTTEPPKMNVSSLTKGKWKTSTASRGLLDCLTKVGYLLPPQVAFAHSLVIVSGSGDVVA